MRRWPSKHSRETIGRSQFKRGSDAVPVPAGISERACREFEASLATLQSVTEKMHRVEDSSGVDSIEFAQALDTYRRARLVWLSNEMQLRSDAVCTRARALPPRRVLIVVSACEPIAASYALLLRLKGYRVMSAQGRTELDAMLTRFAPEAVLLDLDTRFGRKIAYAVRVRQRMRGARVVGLASRPRMVSQNRLLDVTLRKPAPLRILMEALQPVN
ncbi:hypothetical protein [Paraburkholderia rhizosphaerae]|nr:hypothetical protein [Paraburkholderia rhizosphaerae]